MEQLYDEVFRILHVKIEIVNKQSALKLLCNLQIGFAGIHHTCQNILHICQEEFFFFFASLSLANSSVQWRFAEVGGGLSLSTDL